LPETFKEFIDTIGKLFPDTKGKTNAITYLDDEGDLITISSDFDFENCRQLLKKLGMTTLKVNVETTESNSTNAVEETVSTISKLEKKVSFNDDVKVEFIPMKEVEFREEKKEEQKEEVKEEKTFEKVEENIKSLINNGYENIREFVDSNGGIQNLFTIFKDDVVSLKNNVCKSFKDNFNHCGRKFGRFCEKNRSKERKEEKAESKGKVSVEEFKKDLEESIDRMFAKMKRKLVHKMVKKYAVITGEEVEEVAVHRGITCDGCQTRPIVGVRYKCAECRDFDFCENCEKNAKHNPDHVFKKIKKPIRGHGHHHWRQWGNWNQHCNNQQQNIEQGQGKATHFGVRCDGCAVGPIQGIRYKCQVCHNFDFCEKCKANAAHPKEHQFTEIAQPEAGNGINGENDTISSEEIWKISLMRIRKRMRKRNLK